ncbi:MAG: flippase-like domain-containing protein [Anaerolineae bacterium]|nr:flippase-like domain-containing protein [Anaerolineae bacterium]
MKKRWLVFVVGLLISLFFLWLAFRGLELGQVWETLRGANYWWLVPAVAVYFLSVWFRAWRWGFLLRSSKAIPANRLFPVVVIGYMGNDILPFRLGEALRAYVLWRQEQINIGTSLTTAILERLFDGLTMVCFVLFGLLFIPLSDLLSQMVTVASAVFVGALIAFLFLAARPNLLQRLAQAFIDRLVPARFRPPLLKFAAGIVAGLTSLRSGRDVLVLFGVTVCIWLLETAKYWLVSFVFDLQLPYVGIMLMGGAVNLATAIPSLPGFIGTFDLMGIEVLKGIGVPADAAGSYILVLHAILLIPVTLLGLVFMAAGGIRWAEIGAAARMGEEAP